MVIAESRKASRRKADRIMWVLGRTDGQVDSRELSLKADLSLCEIAGQMRGRDRSLIALCKKKIGTQTWTYYWLTPEGREFFEAHKDRICGRRDIEYDGRTRTVGEWSEFTGLPETTIRERIRRGWSPERALTTPLQVNQIRHKRTVSEKPLTKPIAQDRGDEDDI